MLRARLSTSHLASASAPAKFSQFSRPAFFWHALPGLHPFSLSYFRVVSALVESTSVGPYAGNAAQGAMVIAADIDHHCAPSVACWLPPIPVRPPHRHPVGQSHQTIQYATCRIHLHIRWGK